MLKQSIITSVCFFAICSSTTTPLANPFNSTSYQDLIKHGLRVNGTIPAQITLANHQKKTIHLMHITLSPIVAKQLGDNIAAILKNPTSPARLQGSDLPAIKYLGMNAVPVLDQGMWGTCATFATTASIDALFPLLYESQVSQLCNLQLGVTLGNGDDGGWQGSFGYVVFNQINQYGYINKAYQHATGCGSLKNYPTYSFENGNAMPVADFKANSNMTFNTNDWTPIVSYNGSFSPLDPSAAEKALINVKNALNQGYRVVFGSLIDENAGEVGALGTYNYIASDTWVMTPQIQQDVTNNQGIGGHEIIIDGYNDNACATYADASGQPAKQCGLLRIRNSWSALAGDKGDYYMSYDHFKGMAIEVYAIGDDVKDKFKPV